MTTLEIAGVPSTHPSVLLSLFPEALLPAQNGKHRGWSPVPCSDKQVDTKALASLELAWAVWALRERGCITLVPMQKTRGVLFFKRSFSTLSPHPTGAGAAEGLERELLEAVASSTDGSDVGDVVYRWLGTDFGLPFHAVADRVERHGHALAYFAEVDAHPGTVGRLIGRPRTRLEPRCEVIGAARPAFDRCLARWQQFASSEPAVQRDLLAACERGVSMRQEHDDSGPDFSTSD